MSYSETDICIQALALLEEAPLTSYDDDDTTIGRLCRVHYPIARDTLLRSHPWNFAITRASLSAMTDEPISGFPYQYQLPSDCLRLLPLGYEARFNGYPIRYTIEGRAIQTEATSPLLVVYIKRETDCSLYDPLFVDALAKTLAARMAAFITGKQSYAERLMVLAREAVNEAKLLDGMEGTPEDPDAGDWALARWGVDVTGTNFRGEQ